MKRKKRASQSAGMKAYWAARKAKAAESKLLHDHFAKKRLELVDSFQKAKLKLEAFDRFTKLLKTII